MKSDFVASCSNFVARITPALLTEYINILQGMIALRRDATEVGHEDYMDGKCQSTSVLSS